VAEDEHVVSAARIEESEDEAEIDVRDPAAEPADNPVIGDDLAAGPEDRE